MTPTRRKATVFPYRGKWRVQYLDLFGNQRTLSADTRQAAYLKLAQIEGEVRGGFLNPKADAMPSLSQWLLYWLDVRRPELNPTTWHGYESSCRNWLSPAMGELRLDLITPRQIQDLYGYLQTTHELSAGTVRRIHSLLSSAFNLALMQGVLKRSPLQGVKQPKLAKRVVEVFSVEEVERVLKVASRKPPEAHLRWLLALRYGLRQGEVLGLRFADFQLPQMTLKVERTVNSVPGRGIVELPTKSSYGNRTIPIDSEIVGLLSQLSGRAWVFSNEDGNPIDATVDSRRWRALLVEAGVRYLALHAARHTVATHLMQRGVNPRAVQLLLGHSSPAYTLATYVHPGLGELRMALLEPAGNQQLLTS